MRENGSDERRRNMDEKMDYRIGLDIGIGIRRLGGITEQQ